MSHSNSSLNCFANCMAKYEHNYILHTPPSKPVSKHLTFGIMAHDVMYKAGKLRDEINDGVDNLAEYNSIIPSEILYNDLKEEFGIQSWTRYFTLIIKKTAEYERHCQLELAATGDVQIERELKLQMTVDQLKDIGIYNINQPLVGIIDCLLYTKTAAIILDYKFSSNRKTQDDFDMNSQLPLYAMMVHYLYDIPLQNIQVGYIDIPKQEFGMPTVLSNGTLSRAKSQNVSQEFYEAAVKEVHGDDKYYNCKPGGYYYDCWCNLALNRPAYLSKQYIDIDTYIGVTHDLVSAARLIDTMIEQGLPFVRKYDAYTCKACEFVNSCKPWLQATKE
mgnify:CR=1 FL=1